MISDDYYCFIILLLLIIVIDDYLLLLMIICYCNKTNFSSSINEVISPVLNFLFFFHDKISQVQKSMTKHQKALKSTKSTKRH